MHSRTQSKVEPPAKQSKNQLLQQRIPWWKDLEQAVYAELHLPPVREVSLQSIDKKEVVRWWTLELRAEHFIPQAQ